VVSQFGAHTYSAGPRPDNEQSTKFKEITKTNRTYTPKDSLLDVVAAVSNLLNGLVQRAPLVFKTARRNPFGWQYAFSRKLLILLPKDDLQSTHKDSLSHRLFLNISSIKTMPQMYPLITQYFFFQGAQKSHVCHLCIYSKVAHVPIQIFLFSALCPHTTFSSSLKICQPLIPLKVHSSFSAIKSFDL